MIEQKEWEASIAWSKVVVGCVIRRDDGKYLLVQEKQPKVYGLWNLPAGHVDRGESIEQAAVRETREETGFEVVLGDKIGIYHETIETSVRHAFTANIVGGKLRAQPEEILAVTWFSYDEISSMRQNNELRTEWMYDAISRVQMATNNGN